MSQASSTKRLFGTSKNERSCMVAIVNAVGRCVCLSFPSLTSIDVSCLLTKYYEAIGPLPPRLQAPLWRTPPSSPAKNRTKASGGHDDPSEDEDEREAEIHGHKQLISRHRARWEAPQTPPGYWNTEFPDTQEIEAIQKAAAEMREKEKKTRREPEAK